MNGHEEKLASNRRIVPKRYSVEERSGHVKSWKESGLSLSQYSSLHEIPLATFYGWTKTKSNNSVGTFIPLRVAQKKQVPTVLQQELIVEFKNGIRLLIKELIDTRCIVKLIKEIEQCS